MTALLIINYDVTDPERLAAYREPAVAALIGPGRGALFAVADRTVDLGEGNGAGTTTVILEFPSVEAAQNVFESEEYQAVVAERLAATDAKFAVIVPT
ncbi:MAG: DUF1330 domain-containing protein [Acidimicrobiales bacterium]